MSATPTRQKKTLWLYGIIALLLIITVGTLLSVPFGLRGGDAVWD